MDTYLITFLRWPNLPISIYQTTAKADSLKDALSNEGRSAEYRWGRKLVPIRADVLNAEGCWENAWDAGMPQS